VCIGEHFPDKFPVQNGLRRDDLSSLHLSYVLEYVITKVQENQMGQKLKRIHCLLVCAYIANLLENNRNIMKKNPETLN
jgi:hypothetical protein